MERTARHTNLEEFLGAILRGAAKILGCNSTNLILINERTDEIRIILGAMAVSYPVLGQIEQVLGNSLKVISLPVNNIRDSLVYRAWRDCSIRETSSLSELVGGAFASGVTEQVAQLAGDHRFICVPALSGARNYGVLLFTKEGLHPFSRQQRELLLSYARRIGEIVENDLMGQGPSLIAPSTEGPDHLIIDAAGATMRHSGGELARQVLAREEGRLTARVVAFLAGDRVEEHLEGPALGLGPELSLRLSRLQAEKHKQDDWALVALRSRLPARGGSLENQLLQLTLGEAAPALFIDPELRITSCNEATEQLFGYSAGELLQRPVDRLFCAPAEILAILRHQVVDPATPYAEEATTIVRRDGSVCPARIEALCLADELRQVAGFLVLVREAAGGDRAADRLMVQERLATMGEMTTQLAHEIRNPLLAIGATLESLVQESADRRAARDPADPVARDQPHGHDPQGLPRGASRDLLLRSEPGRGGRRRAPAAGGRAQAGRQDDQRGDRPPGDRAGRLRRAEARPVQPAAQRPGGLRPLRRGPLHAGPGGARRLGLCGGPGPRARRDRPPTACAPSSPPRRTAPASAWRSARRSPGPTAARWSFGSGRAAAARPA